MCLHFTSQCGKGFHVKTTCEILSFSLRNLELFALQPLNLIDRGSFDLHGNSYRALAFAMMHSRPYFRAFSIKV